MKELLAAINAHIQGLKLTEKLIVMSDGNCFILFYQSPFAPVHAVEEVSRTESFHSTTIQYLTHWVDTVIEKPRS